MTLDEMEKAMIVKCMRHYGGNITRVAEALGLSRAALYRRLEEVRTRPALRRMLTWVEQVLSTRELAGRPEASPFSGSGGHAGLSAE